jgi:hypothetical protein
LMALIATGIEPHGVTRIFFDCRLGDPDRRPDRRDEACIVHAIESAAAASAKLKELPRAA